MPTPKLLLLSRRTLEHNLSALQKHLEGLSVQMAIALSPEDAEAARKLSATVAQFQYTTAIVADFTADLAVNDDGSTVLLGYTPVIESTPSLITEA